MTLLLARHNDIPAIVVRGGESAPYMVSPVMALTSRPGTGELTCCERGHKLTDRNGAEVELVCDKLRFAPMLFNSCRSDEGAASEETLLDYRWWTAPAPEQDCMFSEELLPQPETIEAFLVEYRFESPSTNRTRVQDFPRPFRRTVRNLAVLRAGVGTPGEFRRTRVPMSCPASSCLRADSLMCAVAWAPSAPRGCRRRVAAPRSDPNVSGPEGRRR